MRMNTDERYQPCDKMIIPVYATYLGNDGLRVDHAMFGEQAVICLQWQEGKKVCRRIAYKPQRWLFGKNYFNPETRIWKY